jgi:hypothetical protein
MDQDNMSILRKPSNRPPEKVARMGDMLIVEEYTLHLGYDFRPEMRVYGDFVLGTDLPMWMKWVEK